jgi:hypothetical protein
MGQILYVFTAAFGAANSQTLMAIAGNLPRPAHFDRQVTCVTPARSFIGVEKRLSTPGLRLYGMIGSDTFLRQLVMNSGNFTPFVRLFHFLTMLACRRKKRGVDGK